MTRPGSSVIAALLLCGLSLAVAAGAQANQYTVYSCHDPAGAAVGDYGWTQSHVGGTFIVTGDTCASQGLGALVAELPGRSGGYGNLERAQWVFGVPPETTIARYTLHIAGSYAQPYESSGAGNADVAASDEADPTYDFRNLGGGSGGAATISREPPDAVTAIQFMASCDAGCGYSAQAVARIDVSSATVLLNDSTAPKVADVSGSLTSGKPLSGPAEASYEASDSGPGIYAAHYVVDGAVQPTVLLDSGQATCANLGETTDGTRAFDSPEPCAKTLDATNGLETANWTDGEHHVQLIVEDASGNSTTAFDGSVTFHNQPASHSAPGGESPFGSLSSSTTSNGSSTYPPGVIDFTGSSGRWLESRNGVTRSYLKSALTLTGRLVSPSRAPLGGQTVWLLSGPLGGGLSVAAHALTDPNGDWRLRAPRGPSRLLRVAYGPQEADAAGAQYTRDVVEHVRPSVSLHVSSYGAGIIAFRGQVGFASVKPRLLALIQAWAHGRWQDVGAPGRVSASGGFSARYSAGQLVGHVYSFRLLIPATHLSAKASSRPASATVR